MKKVVYVIITIFEAALLAGAYIVHYFTVRKLGMLRYILYKNQVLERDYPVTLLKGITVAVILILTLAVLTYFWKKKKEVKKIVPVMVVVMVVLSVYCAGFTLIRSAETVRAYYFISGMSAVSAFIQIIKTFVGIKVCRNEK